MILSWYLCYGFIQHTVADSLLMALEIFFQPSSLPLAHTLDMHTNFVMAEFLRAEVIGLMESLHNLISLKNDIGDPRQDNTALHPLRFLHKDSSEKMSTTRI